jgi:hypothetical protein
VLYMEKYSIFSAEKSKLWEEKAAAIERTIDGRGMRIDAGIKEGVIALNLLGVHTTASCEGHINWGTGGPYIDIEAKETQDMQTKLKTTTDRNLRMASLIEMRDNNLKERDKIRELLTEFYRTRASDPDVRLHIRDHTHSWTRIENVGVQAEEMSSGRTPEQRLAEFQKEMKAFSEFLKEKYWRTL